MVNSTEFGKRLHKILDFYGLSATAFSEVIDFNRSTISHLLSGRNRPSLEFVMKVLQKFPEVELYWFLNGTGTFPSIKKEDPSHSQNDPFISIDKETKSKSSIKTQEISRKVPKSLEMNEIQQIILLFRDGSFKVYEN